MAEDSDVDSGYVEFRPLDEDIARAIQAHDIVQGIRAAGMAGRGGCFVEL
jgi:hypothetical protein